MKWIVFWVVTNTFFVPCDFPDPPPDKYGREQQVSVVLSVACCETTKKDMQKEFDSYEKAYQFMVNANSECGECSDFKMVEYKEVLP